LFALGYVIIGLLLGAAPIVYYVARRNDKVQNFALWIGASAGWLIASLALLGAVYALDGGEFLLGSFLLALIVAAFTSGDRARAFFLSLAAAGASGTLLWWKFDDAHVSTIEPIYLGYFFGVAIVASVVTLARTARSVASDALTLLIAAVFVLQHSFNMSVLLDEATYPVIRHHWGAYIGPSETFLSGARLLYDIPAQYGFGPTLLIASACGKNCWVGMYWITSFASVAYALLIVACASVIARKIGNLWAYAAIVFAAALACMLWTSFPPNLAGPWSFPSTGGLRFVPLSALLLFILWSESRGEDQRPARWPGHVIWCLGAIWAPESAFYLSFVWWPYLLWRAGRTSERPLLAAILSGIEIVAVAAALVVVFVAAYRQIYGVFPSLDIYDAYVVNPTGPLPPNPLGSIWFYLFVIISAAAAASSLIRKPEWGGAFASVFVCLLASFAVFSYYVGRSHDNNILNLAPFLVLTLAATMSFAPLPALSGGARVALASTLACVVFFGWTAWRQTSPIDYANSAPAASMAYVIGETAETTGAGSPAMPALEAGPASPGKSRLDGSNPADAAKAVFYIEASRHEPLIKIDDGMDIAPIGPRAWSALHDPIDFYFLPDSLLAKMIDRTMRRLNVPGWLVIAKKVDSDPETGRWQRLLEASYDKTEEMDFGAYHAIRYAPKPG
jgi:hypothetical protein